MRKVVDVARDCGAEIVGAIAVCNRGGVRREDIGAPQFESLVTLEVDQWPADECVLCERDIPVNIDVGHGKEFLAQKNIAAAGV